MTDNQLNMLCEALDKINNSLLKMNDDVSLLYKFDEILDALKSIDESIYSHGE